jgi:ubiquitin carboxyl-terminal hydrolase 14
VDNVNHIYLSKTRFSSLPQFLIVQMVRFFWKEVNDPDNQFNKPQATKICRVVDFGLKLDLFDLCTEELKATLQVGRTAFEEGKKAEEEQYKK